MHCAPTVCCRRSGNRLSDSQPMSPDPDGGSVCRRTEPSGAPPEALSSELEPKSMASPPHPDGQGGGRPGNTLALPRPRPQPGTGQYTVHRQTIVCAVNQNASENRLFPMRYNLIWALKPSSSPNRSPRLDKTAQMPPRGHVAPSHYVPGTGNTGRPSPGSGVHTMGRRV